LTGNTIDVTRSNVAQMCENTVIGSTSAMNVGISQNIPQNISPNVCQNAFQVVPMVDISPKTEIPCCVPSAQTQPVQQSVIQQPQPQAQTFVAQSQTVPTVVSSMLFNGSTPGRFNPRPVQPQAGSTPCRFNPRPVQPQAGSTPCRFNPMPVQPQAGSTPYRFNPRPVQPQEH